MFYQITKHPSTFRIKSGVDKDGKIVARKCEVFWNGGAYADIGPRVTQKSGLTAAGPYDIDNVWIDSYALYTNVTPAGALRGFGVPQLVWAYEGHTDMMARALKIDPVEFRRKNLAARGPAARDRPDPEGRTGREGAGQGARAHGLVASRSTAAPATIKRGRGFAIAIKAVISPTTSVAIVNVSRRRLASRSIAAPSTWARAPTPRWRRWSREVLNIPTEDVRVAPRDTDVTPYDMGTLGSRSLFHMGHAVRRAAEDARDKLKALAKRGRRAGRLQHPDRRAVPEALRHAGRQRHRLGHLQARLHRRPPPAPGRARTSRRSG